MPGENLIDSFLTQACNNTRIAGHLVAITIYFCSLSLNDDINNIRLTYYYVISFLLLNDIGKAI